MLSYREALFQGDPLQCLPRPIRDQIYTNTILTYYPEFRYIEVPDTRDLNLPLFADFNDKWYVEGCQALIKTATFTLSTDVAIYNLIVFLSEFPDNEGFNNITSLEFTSLSLFSRGPFTPSATHLLRRCSNLKHLTLIINLNDLPFTNSTGVQELDIPALTNTYDLAAITHLGSLHTVDLVLKPFMALEKRLAKMEFERKMAEAANGGRIGKGTGTGVECFWGLKDWLEGRAFEEMILIEVRCPRVGG